MADSLAYDHDGHVEYVVASDRPEHEPCERGTVGCCVRHDEIEHQCEAW